MKQMLPVAVLALLTSMAWAVIETYEFSSLENESRYHRLSQELRCPKCQNQNIADSNAPIARDLRALLHRQLEAGASDEEILTFMVERYGEFVRYRPAVNKQTAVLWIFPAAAVAIGLMVLVIHLRRRQRVPRQPEPSETELAGLRTALAESSRAGKE